MRKKYLYYLVAALTFFPFQYTLHADDSSSGSTDVPVSDESTGLVEYKPQADTIETFIVQDRGFYLEISPDMGNPSFIRKTTLKRNEKGTKPFISELEKSLYHISEGKNDTWKFTKMVYVHKNTGRTLTNRPDYDSGIPEGLKLVEDKRNPVHFFVKKDKVYDDFTDLLYAKFPFDTSQEAFEGISYNERQMRNHYGTNELYIENRTNFQFSLRFTPKTHGWFWDAEAPVESIVSIPSGSQEESGIFSKIHYSEHGGWQVWHGVDYIDRPFYNIDYRPTVGGKDFKFHINVLKPKKYTARTYTLEINEDASRTTESTRLGFTIIAAYGKVPDSTKKMWKLIFMDKDEFTALQIAQLEEEGLTEEEIEKYIRKPKPGKWEKVHSEDEDKDSGRRKRPGGW